ncbi:MAG: sigma-54-dependent Fis family transcriptional regulator [Phycisphaeraceae bacterium]|nr:sigma-54-dependent Fis family transcriptional regulator [Phycisphaeraceae bacterium]MCB9848029.1 sigma-54-dependent Fis family transcriptional regulator [Phycisphaeraceae bacterium]
MPTPPTAAETPRAQVLIVEDEQDHAEVMADALRGPGHVSTIVGSVEGALDELRHGAFDVIVTDLRMPESGGANGVSEDGGDAGLVVLRAARELQPDAETVMVTAHGDVSTARAAFKDGAYDFIEKPLDLALFRKLINRAAETVLLRHQANGMDELVQHDGFEGIVAGSEPMRRILDTVRTVAPSNLPVLITGASGVGKELIAEAVHKNSDRASKRFVTMNCAGQSESLLEDQLFGHVKGAYTGADKEREGVFEYADGGTLFLDEIGDMPLTMQAKLLRVLESGEVVRLGANEARHVDVRIVSATNRDLSAMLRDESFRQDLYFRINGAEIHIPPLSERREDIPRIVRHAAAKFSHQLDQNTPVPEIDPAVMDRLTAFDWPGNVRQLLNAVQGMVVIARGAGDHTIGLRHLPAVIAQGDTTATDAVGVAVGSLAGASLEQLEKRAIRETLRLTGGNREKAAKMLGIGERTLYRKLKEYGLR